VLLIKARWVLPIATDPIPHGWVIVEGGRVAAVGAQSHRQFYDAGSPAIDLGHVAILPGLVNTHTHLELSWLLGHVPRARRFTDWVRTMLRARSAGADRSGEVAAAMDRALDEMRATGTAAVGDVSNTLASVEPLRARQIPAVVFHELLRLRSSDADLVLEEGLRQVARHRGGVGGVRVTLAPHAPYSVSPRLFQGIRRQLDADPFAPTTVHVGESPEEIELLRTGDGEWRRLLEELGAWDAAWIAPRSGPVEYLDRMKFIGARTLVVHGTQLGDGELQRLAGLGATLVTCPRSNEYVGVGTPPVARFYASGVTVALGTDSLASNDDVNLFAELAAARRAAPAVHASRLLESATRHGAHALGLETTHGSIEPGKSADLLAADIPREVVDVEEYLVTAVPSVRWITDLVSTRTGT
jgi:aminodeoxyfutalosine deaminase